MSEIPRRGESAVSVGACCPRCGLVHSPRPDGRCPRRRCDTNPRAGRPRSRSSKPPASSISLAFVLELVLVLGVIIGAIAWGSSYFRYQAAVDYSVDMGSLKPLAEDDWVATPDAKARIRVPSQGWFAHKRLPDEKQLLLSCPKTDTHVVLRVETLGFGRPSPAPYEVAERISSSLGARASALEIVRSESLSSGTPDGEAHRLDVEVTLEARKISYNYGLFSRADSIATLACFGPHDVLASEESECSAILDSFSWSSSSATKPIDPRGGLSQ